MDGVFYYAMEYLDGVNLEDLVRHHGAQPPGRVRHILARASDARAAPATTEATIIRPGALVAQDAETRSLATAASPVG